MNERLGSINFQGGRFDVVTATIEGVLNTRRWAKFHGQPYGVKWYIEVTAKSLNKNNELEISFNGLGLRVTSWQDFSSVNFCWETWQNPTTNSPYMQVEAGETYIPDSGTFRVVHSRGNMFTIHSNGRIEGIELYTMDAEFTFQGIRVFGETTDTEVDLHQRLETELPGDRMLLTDFTTNLQTVNPNSTAYFAPQTK